jgi:hypothetical protein
MIVVKKMKDDDWMQTWYVAEATKVKMGATGKTRKEAICNLKTVLKKEIRNKNN